MSTIQLTVGAAIDAAQHIQDEIKQLLPDEWVAVNGAAVYNVPQAMIFIWRGWHEMLQLVRARAHPETVAESMIGLSGCLLKMAIDLRNLPSEASCPTRSTKSMARMMAVLEGDLAKSLTEELKDDDDEKEIIPDE